MSNYELDLGKFANANNTFAELYASCLPKEDMLRFVLDNLTYSEQLTAEGAKVLAKLLRDEADFLDNMVHFNLLNDNKNE